MKKLNLLCRTLWSFAVLNLPAADPPKPLPGLYIRGHSRMFISGPQSAAVNPVLCSGNPGPAASLTFGNLYGVRELYNLSLCSYLPVGQAALSACHSEFGNPVYRTGTTSLDASLQTGKIRVATGAGRNFIKTRNLKANTWFDLRFSIYSQISERVHTSMLAERIIRSNPDSQPGGFRMGWGICYFPEKHVALIAELHGIPEALPQLKTMAVYKTSGNLTLSLGAQNRFSEFAFGLSGSFSHYELGCVFALHPLLGLSSSVSCHFLFYEK